ncbi:hypothetical protein CTI12_AA378560 [Artemisia annua]|uniref:Uncharacterized protein n=1 Tax=Artemisia annua TaxID=35608 RepID=A0A2U1MHC7_ARTAN|nr:hypothetical protein CTI12_AA378560 [Artemisia annua]
MYVTDHFPCLARLVTMLADLGQRGGILRLVGKLALLWGGIRGAMSLIGKLITFLRLSERPLFQRSPMAIPGLWLLSVGLAGVRQRFQGSLFVPIGLRTGIMASSVFLKEGGFLSVRQRFQGSLFVPIGLRTGIMASSFFLKGGFLIYQPTYPLWLSGGGDPFQPFSSTVSLAVLYYGH